jgi:predicted DNA-binding helix-hairpin-helix protein
MPFLQSAPTLRQKLETLAADAQYDLSCACGTTPDDHRRRAPDDRWLYPVTLQGGGRGLMFKTLLSNACTNDCRYCPPSGPGTTPSAAAPSPPRKPSAPSCPTGTPAAYSASS